MLNLKGKIAIVLGLGQASPTGYGIGSAIAVLLARQGAIIVGGNRTITSADITKSRIEAEGGICDIVQTDATSSGSVKNLIDTTLAKYSRVDIFVNNVGRSAPGDPASMSEETWDDQVAINLKPAYLVCHHVLPVMEAQAARTQIQARGDGATAATVAIASRNEASGSGGCIVSISSVAGLRYIGKPQSGYSATKAALIHLMKTTAVMYASRGVRLNTVVPGLMHTPYTDQLAERYGATTPEQKREYMHVRNEQVPMRRMGDAWDVANAVLFLVSDEARYITGQEIVVDGGFTASTGRG